MPAALFYYSARLLQNMSEMAEIRVADKSALEYFGYSEHVKIAILSRFLMLSFHMLSFCLLQVILHVCYKLFTYQALFLRDFLPFENSDNSSALTAASFFSSVMCV